MRPGGGQAVRAGLAWGVSSLWDAFLAEHQRWILWLPVLVGLGITIYFFLPDEPPVAISAAVLAGSLLAAVAAARQRQRWPAVYVCAMVCAATATGFAAAQLQAGLLTTRMLAAPVGPATVQGRVVDVESFPDGQRVTLEPFIIPGKVLEATPGRARVRLRGTQPVIRPGDEIEVRAMLVPPPPPQIPGAYDYQRQAYFERIGAVGYSVGRATVAPASGQAEDGGLLLWFAHLRFLVGERVRATLQGATAAVTLALLTGEQRAVPDADMNAIRNSGLAHLLSISGLHIGLVAGIVLFVVRGGLALVPAVALRWPVKKWAALVSVAAAGAYTLLAGAPVPSQRSFFMISVVLLAMLVDRQGVSMRLVAFAAAVVLLTQPTSLLGPSFQMSFGAVVALLAAYEVMKERRRVRPAPTDPPSRLPTYLAGVLLTTIVATMATTPYAVYHFNRVQIYGLAANAVAVPLTSFWIMPWAVLAMLLMPFGLEYLALIPMGWGVDGVLWIARTVAAWPGSVVVLPVLPTWGLATVTVGGLWLCLWQGRWRLLGLVAIVAGGAALRGPSPDLFVDAGGRMLAVRDADGKVLFSLKSSGRSIREAWLRRVGSDEAPGFWPQHGLAGAESLLRCDGLGCVYRAHGHVIAIVRHADALSEDCRLADIVVSYVPVPNGCASAKTVIDRTALGRDGAHVVWLEGERVRIETVGTQRGDRPWVARRDDGPVGTRARPARAAVAAPSTPPEPAAPADDE